MRNIVIPIHSKAGIFNLVILFEIQIMCPCFYALPYTSI